MNQNNSERDSERYRMDKVRDEEITLYHNKNQMREYRIFRTDLWWSIYRKKQVGKFLFLQFLSWKNQWIMNKTYARIFYQRDEAESVLVIMKAKDEKKSD